MIISKNNPEFLSQALKNALAQQYYEGLSPSNKVISGLEQVIAGILTVDDVIGNIGKRHHVQVFGR